MRLSSPSSFVSSICASAALLFCFAAPHLQAEPQKPIRALLVTGGCCHDYETQKRILTEGISARAKVEWTVVHEGTDRNSRNSVYSKPDWANGFDIVVHNECYGAIDDVAFVESIAAPHKAGIPAVMLHCSAHSYRAAKTDEWRMAVGITSTSHEKNRDLTIQRLNGEHPIMKGFPETWADPADELYKNDKVWPTAVPLAKAYGQDTGKDHVVIWTNTYGKARVFSTTLGHNNATMQDRVYLDLVARGLLWACDKLDPDGKPVQGYEATQK